MTPRNRIIKTLELARVGGRVPHFELVFFLTMEALGKVHPLHRVYAQWFQMTGTEQRLQRLDMARVYIETAKLFHHSAIVLYPNPDTIEELMLLADTVRELSGNEYFLLVHGDATFGIPEGGNMEAFCCRIADNPSGLHKEACRHVESALARAEIIWRHGGVDGFVLCSDYCLNSGPFLSPAMFSEFVAPYLDRLIREYRAMGFYTIKHTDGNIMPILDQLVQTNPHALHSLDPQAGVDIAIVKRLYGDRLCLMGNVDCGLLHTGSDQEVVESAGKSLQSGMQGGGGYVFSTSNCIYTGMPLERYRLMLDVWQHDGVYGTMDDMVDMDEDLLMTGGM